MSINLKPLADRVLIEPAAAETTTSSGIIIPDTAKEKPQEGDLTEGNMEITYVAMFQNGDIEKARKYIVENADQNSYEKIYRKMYENLEWFGDTEEKQNRALLAIREGIVNHAVVVDPEINLAATMVELEMIRGK